MNLSKGASIANASNTSIDQLLLECLQSPPPSQVVSLSQQRSSTNAQVDMFQSMIRQTLVDWGDHIIDSLATHFEDSPKILQMLERVRKEEIDPMRRNDA
jgi:hypothetical protein